MTSKALEAAAREYIGDIFDLSTVAQRERILDEVRPIIRAFADNLSEEAAEAAASVRYEESTFFLPQAGNADHKSAVKRCIQAAIERDLE